MYLWGVLFCCLFSVFYLGVACSVSTGGGSSFGRSLASGSLRDELGFGSMELLRCFVRGNLGVEVDSGLSKISFERSFSSGSLRGELHPDVRWCLGGCSMLWVVITGDFAVGVFGVWIGKLCPTMEVVMAVGVLGCNECWVWSFFPAMEFFRP
ncbi:hypothetical protein CsSME_00043139 [Camellia sinensis var. sinensis]